MWEWRYTGCPFGLFDATENMMSTFLTRSHTRSALAKAWVTNQVMSNLAKKKVLIYLDPYVRERGIPDEHKACKVETYTHKVRTQAIDRRKC